MNKKELSLNKTKLILGSINCINNLYSNLKNLKFICLELPDLFHMNNANTIYIRISDLNISLNYKIIDLCGNTFLQGKVKCSDMFKDLIIDLSSIDKLKDIFSNENSQSIVPLFYINYNINNSSNELLFHFDLYSQLRYSENDIIFIKTNNQKESYSGFKDNLESNIDSIFIKKAIEYHNKNAVFLGNHQCYYRKEESDFEIEYKFNLLNNADPWKLCIDLYNEIKTGNLNNYILEYKDEFQKWDYLNYLFEITGPEADIGYISFIPQTNNKYLIKRKIYKYDQLKRKEIHFKNIDIKGSLDEYLKNNFNVDFIEYPPFRRVRYDINIESLITGNVHGIFFDYISIDGRANVLMQCEIEYLRTRSLFSNQEYKNEMDEIKNFVINFLKNKKVDYIETFYSKLNFLKDTFNKN